MSDMKLIMENWERFLNEADFDPASGEPITDRGRELEKKMVEIGLAAENKCFEWAKADPLRHQELIDHHKSGGKGFPPKVLEACPHKADDEAHRRLAKVRDRAQRAETGQAPAEDDASQIAKVRRRSHLAKQGLSPAEDDTSQIAKVRRAMAAKKT